MLKAMLRGLVAHKLRLILSALAVILGTAFMTAAFVGGDTIKKGFNELFSTVNENIDVQVTGKTDLPEAYAKDHNVPVGSTVTMRTARGATESLRVVGTCASNRLINPPSALVTLEDGKGFRSALAQQAYVKVGDPGQIDAVRARMKALVADNPEVTVSDPAEQVKQATTFLDLLLTVLNVLLGLIGLRTHPGARDAARKGHEPRPDGLDDHGGGGPHLRFRRTAWHGSRHRIGHHAGEDIRRAIPQTHHSLGVPGDHLDRRDSRRFGGRLAPRAAGGSPERAAGHRLRVGARMIAYEQASGHSLRSPWGSTRGQRTGDHSDHGPTFEPGSRGTVNP
jgi:hypothetical protein